MPSIESYQLLLAAAAACEDKKAEDIRILALNPEESGLSDYFLICNGTNERQNDAISDEIELRLKREFNTYPNAVEGRRQADWILMDYVDFIVHIFSPEKRAFYGLERLRKSAVTVSTDQLTSELKSAMEAQLAPKRASKRVKPKTGAEPETGDDAAATAANGRTSAKGAPAKSTTPATAKKSPSSGTKKGPATAKKSAAAAEDKKPVKAKSAASKTPAKSKPTARSKAKRQA